MITYIALFLRIISNPFANVFQKKICENNSPLICNFNTYFILSICCIPFIFSVNWMNLSLSFWIYASLAGFLCSAGNACLVKALQIGELSVLGPINSYKSIIGMFVAIFVLGEIPSLFGLIGIILIIWGSRFIFETQAEGFSIKILFRKDITGDDSKITFFRNTASIPIKQRAINLNKISFLNNILKLNPSG